MNLNVIPVIMVKYKSKVFEELRKKDCNRRILLTNFLNGNSVFVYIVQYINKWPSPCQWHWRCCYVYPYLVFILSHTVHSSSYTIRKITKIDCEASVSNSFLWAGHRTRHLWNDLIFFLFRLNTRAVHSEIISLFKLIKTAPLPPHSFSVKRMNSKSAASGTL